MPSAETGRHFVSEKQRNIKELGEREPLRVYR